MLEQMKNAIAELESARNEAQNLYSASCSETYERVCSFCQGKFINAEVRTIAPDGDSKFLLMADLLDAKIDALRKIVSRFESVHTQGNANE